MYTNMQLTALAKLSCDAIYFELANDLWYSPLTSGELKEKPAEIPKIWQPRLDFHAYERPYADKQAVPNMGTLKLEWLGNNHLNAEAFIRHG